MTLSTEQDLINEGFIDGKKSFEYLWQGIEENFDWSKVYQTMKIMDWHWCIDKTKDLYGIPNIDTIKKSAKELLSKVWGSGKGRISTGGFTAACSEGELSLSFIVDECYTGDL